MCLYINNNTLVFKYPHLDINVHEKNNSICLNEMWGANPAKYMIVIE